MIEKVTKSTSTNTGNPTLIVGRQKSASKRVVQYSQIGTEITRWESAREASDAYGTSEKPWQFHNIHKACNGQLRSAYGFVWKYEEELHDGK